MTALLDETLAAAALLLEPGAVAELRIPNTRRATVSGYFDDFDKLARSGAGWSGKAAGVYVTLNPVNPSLLARAVNRLTEYARHTTADSDILRRCWLPLDFDSCRPSGISATDAEHEAALTRAREVRAWLRDQGWPEPIYADSGNGGHLVCRIDLPNDADAATLVGRCLEALAFHWDDDAVTVDRTTYNAARIWKMYGTLAAKGDHTPDRPHRMARLLEAPSVPEAVPRELLERLAATAPQPGLGGRRTASGGFDLARWIEQHQLPVVATGTWNGGRKWILSPCPWNSSHINRAAYIVQFPNGAIAAGCHHNGCTDKNWHALRDLVEPQWREKRSPTGAAPAGGCSGDEVAPSVPVLVRLADVPREEVSWLREPYVPLRRLTILEGDPGVGKSKLAQAIAAAVTTGAPLAGQTAGGEPANVLLLTAEDDLADTVRPWMEDMRADLSRVTVLRAVRDEKGNEHHLSLVDDLPALEFELAAGSYKLVIIDPINAYLGMALDTHRDAALRAVLTPLAQMAERWDVAVLCIRHLTKGSRDRAIYRGIGSIAYAAAARAVYVVGQNPDDERERVMACVKNNLAPMPPSLAFELTDGRFLWRGETTVTAAALLMPDKDDEERTALEEAKSFLRDTLAGGSRPIEEVKQDAKDAGISQRTMERAKTALGIRAFRQGEQGRRGGGAWYWALPDDLGSQRIKTAKNTSIGNLASLTESVSAGAFEPDNIGGLNPPEAAISDNGRRAAVLSLWEELGRPPVSLKPAETITDLEKWLSRGSDEDVAVVVATLRAMAAPEAEGGG